MLSRGNNTNADWLALREGALVAAALTVVATFERRWS
jgi:hypothetical protein